MPKIDIKIQPSQYLLIFFAILVLLTLMVIFNLPCAIWIKVFLIVGLLLYSYYIFKKQILLTSPKAIIRVQKECDQSWKIYDRQGNCYWGELQRDSTVTKFIIILCFKISPLFSKSVVLCKDTLSLDDYRRLIVQLRLL